MNKYTLTLTSDYCDDWKAVHGVRELLQNCLDSPAEFRYKFVKDELHLTSVGVELPTKTLLLGTSTKRNDSESVGGKGEGFKVGVSVLLREGLDVEINNKTRSWFPCFEYSEQYQAEVLTIYEETIYGNDDLTFVVKGIDEELKQEIIDSCLYLQEDLKVLHEGASGRIIDDGGGKLFVGGLYVTKTSLDYTYDFHPSVLTLNRDRQSVSSFDLEWETGRLWQQVEDASKVAQMVFDKVPDTRMVRNYPSLQVRNECFNLYKEKYGNKPIVQDTQKQEIEQKRGFNNIIVTGNMGFTDIVTGHSEYREHIEEHKNDESPLDLLSKLYDNLDVLDEDAIKYEVEELYEKFSERGVMWMN